MDLKMETVTENLAIPTLNKCLSLMDDTGMPEHIKKHSFVVAEIALYLGHLCNQEEAFLNLSLLQAGALLHDIAKARTLLTGEKHAEVGACMVEQWGYSPVASIIRDHVNLDFARLNGPLSESLIVNYADKRVKHDRIVSLQDRFDDLINRYAATPEHRSWLEKKLTLYESLEERIFGSLRIGPEYLERVVRPGCFHASLWSGGPRGHRGNDITTKGGWIK
jgi:uncharacterized protein